MWIVQRPYFLYIKTFLIFLKNSSLTYPQKAVNMQWQLSGTSPVNLFRSKAEALISSAAAPVQQIIEQDCSSEGQPVDASTQLGAQVFPNEIFLLIGMTMSTVGEFKNFSMASLTFFNLSCEILSRKFKPRPVEGKVELPPPSIEDIVADTISLLTLPYSERANRAFDSNNKAEYALQHNRLFRELFSYGCSYPLRGNFIKMADLLLSNRPELTYQDLIDTNLDPELPANLGQPLPPGINSNGQLSPEHTFYFLNNLVELATQKPGPNIAAFLDLLPLQVKYGISDETEVSDIERMFESKMFLNPRATDHKQHLLPWAAANNRLAWVKELVESDVSVNLCSRIGGTALHGAAKNGHKDIIKYLFENKASIEEFDQHGLTSFLNVVSHQPVDTVIFFVNTWQKIPTSSTLLKQREKESGLYAVEIAAENNDIAKVEYLIGLAELIDPDDIEKIQWKSQSRALRYAVKLPSIVMAESLIKYKADIAYTWKDEEQKTQTLLHTAVRNRRTDVAMLSYLADRLESLFNTHANDLLQLAFARDDLAIWEFVVEKGKKVFEFNKSEDEAGVLTIRKNLLTATYHFSPNIVEALLKKDNTLANRTANEDSFTPLHHAIDARATTARQAERQLKIVEILLDHGAKIDIVHGDFSPLTSAVLQNLPAIAELLVSGRENIYAYPALSDRQEHLRTALRLASEINHADIFDVLVSSPYFDTSCSEENFDLLAEVAENAQHYTAQHIYDQYALVISLVNQLVHESYEGASAVLRVAIQRGRADIARIFFNNPEINWLPYEEIFALLEASEHSAIAKILEDFDTASEITVSDLGSNDGSF